MASDDGTDGARSGAPEERKTETTLTTRIRINIPGSRPIPPVVVRKPVGDGESAEGAREERPAAEVRTPAAAAPAPQAPAEPAAPAEEKTSDWFAPRKSSGGKAATGKGGANGGRNPGGSPAGAPGARPGGPGANGAAGGTGARPGGVVGSMSVPGRSGKTNGSGLPGATGGPVAPGHGGGTGSFDVTEALAAGPLGGGSRVEGNGGEPRRDDLPYFSEHGGQDGFGGPAGAGGVGGADGANGPGGRGGPQGPAGPTGGPVTGDSPLLPGTGGYGGQGGAPGRSALTDIADLDGPGAPGGPASAPGAGLGPGGGLSDDTAILTPQKPAPEPGTPGYRAPDNVSGHTVTSGIPVVPGGNGAPFGAGGPGGPAGQTAAKPAPEPAKAAPKAAAKPKKGRSKLVLLAVGVVVIAGGVYGAGLLMNHTDVPKGTTVLGVDIGGGTRDDAVKKLDDAFGSRVAKPLKLDVGGKTVTLTPANAGLQFDFQATASQAATSDYNPVSVVGTLFGQKRVVAPVMPVDEEKLQAALRQAGGGSGSGAVVEGGIEFKPGKAVAVYGKPGRAIDAAGSAQAIEQAYRTAVETNSSAPVTVPTTNRQPTVSNAEVDREMKEFAEPAMSAKVTVMTDAAHAVPLSPQNSLWKFLHVTAVNGKLVDKPDLAALQQLYGKAFDGVLITRGNGKKTPVTPQDVYGALRQALMSKTNRVAVISTNPN